MRSFVTHFLEIFSESTNKIVFASLLFFILPLVTSAASLSFSPASGSYKTGAVFSVGIIANSGGQALNAVSGVVAYPQDLLEVVSISKNQSIVSLWVQEPYFSNSEGTINFEGIVLNPGFNGTSGKILNVTFRAKSEGSPSLSFSSGSILANDGEGSEILSGRDKALYLIEAPTVEVSQPESPRQEIPTIEEEKNNLLPQVTSETNPIDGWSDSTTGIFNFSFGEEVTSMRLLLDDKPNSIPTVVYAPPIASREIKDLEEGTSYLHIQYKNSQGWGEILHYKIQIDTKAPESLVVKEISSGIFLLEAKDELSGITRYEIQIDGGEIFEFIDDGSHIYKTPELPAGQHTIFLKAFDAASNFITATSAFETIALVVEAPSVKPISEVPTAGFLVPNGAIFITVLSVVIPSLALILLLCFLLYAAWRSVGGLKRRIDKEVREASLIVNNAFMLLKSDLELDIESLKKANKKRKLTREESRILKRLQKNLAEAEKAISKEISDIEKEIK